MTRMPWSPVAERRAAWTPAAVDVAGHHHRLFDAGGNVGIEPPRLVVRRDRLLQQPAVAQRVHEPGEELRLVAVPRRVLSRRTIARWRLPDIGLEVGVELVGDRKPGVERQRAVERLLCPARRCRARDR